MVSHWGHAVGYDCDLSSPSYPLHTHTISTSYLYNVFKSLQPWLTVIMPQHHTIPSLTVVGFLDLDLEEFMFIELQGRWASVKDEADMRLGVRQGGCT